VHAWLVPNLRSGAVYAVEELRNGCWRCSYPSLRFGRGASCKHCAVLASLLTVAEAAGLAERILSAVPTVPA
jgi:hypothetical protein